MQPAGEPVGIILAAVPVSNSPFVEPGKFRERFVEYNGFVGAQVKEEIVSSIAASELIEYAKTVVERKDHGTAVVASENIGHYAF